MHPRRIAAAALLAALGGLTASARAEILVVPPTPTQGERAVITIIHAGTEEGNIEVQAVYRPGSKVSSTQVIGKTRLDGRLTWIPEGAGVVTLQAVVDSTAMSKTLSVRFRGVPLSGLAILIGAGVILYGGVLWGFRQLTALPPELPPDTEQPGPPAAAGITPKSPTGIFDSIVTFGNNYVWGWPSQFPLIVALLLGAGLFATLRLSFIQVRAFGHGWKVVAGKYDDPAHAGDISHFQALSTALSATVGIGNIAGVATAIHYGGPGALFWMWITACFGMALKYVECTLSMQYRVFDTKGEAAGGPMYYIERGIGKAWKPMAVMFAFCAVISSFGSGNMNQANTVSLSASTTLGAPSWLSGAIMASLVGLVIIGGIKRIGAVSSKLAPAMFVLYSLGGIFIVGKHLPDLPAAFALILREAFHPSAGVGGTAAGVFATTLVWGIKRGLFSNEAGQGSAPIAHAAAKTDQPVREGVVAMLGPFIDTLVICSFTGLAIVLTGVWSDHKPMESPLDACTVVHMETPPARGDAASAHEALTGSFTVVGGVPESVGLVENDGFVLGARILGGDGSLWSGTLEAEAGTLVNAPTGLIASGEVLQNSSALTQWAFEREMGGLGGWIVTLSVFLFALSTTISWSYYGDRCAEYLFGARAVPVYRWLYTGFVFLGAVLALEVVWAYGDLALGLMAAPNLIAIFILTNRVKRSTDQYFSVKHPPLR